MSAKSPLFPTHAIPPDPSLVTKQRTLQSSDFDLGFGTVPLEAPEFIYMEMLRDSNLPEMSI